MPKIQFNPVEQQISVSGKIGKNGDATVTLDPEVQEIGINLGIIELGATTDYGGAITLGIAGQSVTWGTEGGQINLGVGGFEVKVEARDCVVVEEKFIFGQLVASRSYRDPGCGPDEEPEYDPPELPPPPPSVGINPATITDINDGYVLVGQYYSDIVYNFPNPWIVEMDKRGHTTIEEVAEVKCGQLPETVVAPSFYDWWTIPVHLDIKRENLDTRWVNDGFVYSTSGYTYFSDVGAARTDINFNGVRFRRTPFGSGAYTSTYRTGPHPPPLSGIAQGFVCFGSMRAIAQWVIEVNKPDFEGTPRKLKHIINRVIPLGKRKPPIPLLSTGNKPPMQDCCEEVLDELADIKEGLGIDRLRKDKFPVSNTFMAPECDPASVTKAENWYEIIQCLFRVLAHGLIFEPRVAIKDADAAKAGDQEFKTRYLNATGWASAMAEAMLEVKDDGNVATNMDIRSGFAATQTMVGVADIAYKVDVILDCLGITLMPKIEQVQTPYNCHVKVGKGFGEGNERQIDLNQDEATEKLLPEFLKTKINKLKTVAIHPRSETILEVLQRIESSLPPQSNG